MMLHAVAILLLGVAVLVGSLRTQMAHQRVSRFLARLKPESAGDRSLRDALAEALEDSSLTLHYRRPDSGEYVDARGLPAPLPSDGNRNVTFVGPEEEPLAALVHDPILAQQPRQRERLDAVVAAARLALENASLHAKDRAHLRGILKVELDTRQNIRGMLHDGPQHRLSGIQHLVGKVRKHHGSEVLDTGLKQIADELEHVVHDLREVTEGVYPSILRMNGLADALDPLVQRSPIPLILDVARGRWPDRVEETAFFVISEAVGNAQKHANASRIIIRVREEDGHLVAEVSDDGRGGAVFTSIGGSGLRGMRDRVGVHDGTLIIENLSEEGTIVRAVLPCA